MQHLNTLSSVEARVCFWQPTAAPFVLHHFWNSQQFVPAASDSPNFHGRRKARSRLYGGRCLQKCSFISILWYLWVSHTLATLQPQRDRKITSRKRTVRADFRNLSYYVSSSVFRNRTWWRCRFLFQTFSRNDPQFFLFFRRDALKEQLKRRKKGKNVVLMYWNFTKSLQKWRTSKVRGSWIPVTILLKFNANFIFSD